jgi:hypothetical protein
VAASLEPETKKRKFDLVTSYPVKSLKDSLEKTLVEEKLFGSQVILRWIE